MDHGTIITIAICVGAALGTSIGTLFGFMGKYEELDERLKKLEGKNEKAN